MIQYNQLVLLQLFIHTHDMKQTYAYQEISIFPFFHEKLVNAH